MAYKLEQIFHTEPKVIGMVEIYSNPMDRDTVKDIEKVIKSIAKNLRIDLNNIPSGDVLRVYIYPTKRVFYSIFGKDIERNTMRKRSRTQEDMLFVVGEGEIHMVSPKATGKSYINMIKILVKDILNEYGLDEKVKKAQEKVKEELEPQLAEEEPEEELEEPEAEEIEEDVEEVDEIEQDEELLEQDNQEIEELEQPETVEFEETEELEQQDIDDIVDIDFEVEEIKEDVQKEIPEWLDLGWLMYKRQILANEKNREYFADYIKRKGVAKLNKISWKQSIMKEYNYASESSYAIVEYIIENYGIKKIPELFSNPNVKEVLGISEEQFKRESTESIKRRYLSMKMEEISKEEPKAKSRDEK